MKKYFKYITLVGLAVMASNVSLGREKPKEGSGMAGSKPPKPSPTMLKAANCSPTQAVYKLEFNDVSAIIETGGRMFQQTGAQGNAGYEVPRTELGNGPKAIYSGSLWMGGKDLSGQLKLAALCFRQDGSDFWAGPLQVPQIPATNVNVDVFNPITGIAISPYGLGGTTSDECLAWDKFFPMSKAAVIKFTTHWEACHPNSTTANPIDCAAIEGDLLPTNEEIAAINNWPAHGDTGVEEGDSNQDHYMAPYFSRDGGGDYDPDNGDTPWYDDILSRNDIECGVDRRIALFGDNTVWWVFNDQGNIHTNSQGEPIGMEIRAQAFTFSTADEINRMTFYNYELINRSSQTLTNTFFSQYLDPDVGNSLDDYAGCDVSRGLGFCYNADPVDETNSNSVGYGNNPPAIGVDFFEGPYQDPDGLDNPGPTINLVTGLIDSVDYNTAIAGNGIVYRGIGVGYGDDIIDNERFGMRRFASFIGNGGVFPQTDPDIAVQYYNFMQGLWSDGSPMTYGGTGIGGSLSTSYIFPGDSDFYGWATGGLPQAEWSEVTENNPIDKDKRIVQSAGPFTLLPGATNNITVGIVYGRSLEGPEASVDVMKVADTKAQALFDACFRIIDPPNAPKLTIQELENELVLMLENPVPSNNENESYDEIDDINIPPTVSNRRYKFQGYQIFQMVNDAASVADISDNTKARLVAQCDVKDEVSKIINWEFDESIGFASPVVKVNGSNTGIKHSFRLTEDAFASGDKRLINHKTYYYVAVAYAHNEYKKFDYNDPDLLDGQKTPYIVSRLGYNQTAIRAQAGIPHNPRPEADGTYQNVEFGTIPRITRLDGTGNGYGILELTTASTNQILNAGSMADPTYEINGGPIKVKVVDPLNVAGGYYELKFRDYVANTVGNVFDTARWTAYRYDFQGGSIIDSVMSDRWIKEDNEQIIPEWGVSIQIYQDKYVASEAGGNITTNVTDPLSATINFADSNNRWLTFVPDNDQFFPYNWIRSGTYSSPTTDHLPAGSDAWIDPLNYKDEIGFDNDKVFAKLLNGGVAPHKLIGYQADYMPLAYHPAGDQGAINLARNNAGISYHPSVDIVITSDKSKWTRCPVIETGRVASLNVGGAKPGELRKSPSKLLNGQNDPSETGMGWFPGYAIDLETGTRMHMAFGENSFLSSDKGADMEWNPTSRIVLPSGEPIFGGVQPIWVFAADLKKINSYPTLRDFPAYIPSVDGTSANFLKQKYDVMQTGSVTDATSAFRDVFSNLTWVCYPLTIPGQTTRSSDVTIKLRMNKEYKNYITTGINGGRPMYSWNMDGFATNVGSSESLASALDMINIVPNPYYAFSEYERTRIDTRVKITNLPEKCTINIYTSNGKLIRTFKKDSEITSVDWDLNNNKRIPIASGVYLIHVEVPDIGERVLKFFAGMRQVDLQGI